MKKDNKGFSLVELIVVVLIMGILAVALTPQVMKWVKNARISSDYETVEAVKAAAVLALANEGVNKQISDATDFAIELGASSAAITGSAPTGFSGKLDEYLGKALSSVELKSISGSTKVTISYVDGKYSSDDKVSVLGSIND